MTLAELKTLLETTKLPVTYEAWPIGHAPALPVICYRVTGSNNFDADNKVYFPTQILDIELYTETKSPTTEETVEAALNSLCWEKSEEYISDERMYQITYTINI